MAFVGRMESFISRCHNTLANLMRLQCRFYTVWGIRRRRWLTRGWRLCLFFAFSPMFPLQQIRLISELDRCRITTALEIEPCTLDEVTVRARLEKTARCGLALLQWGFFSSHFSLRERQVTQPVRSRVVTLRFRMP